MFAKLVIIAATSIAAVRACTNASPFPNNTVSAPSMNDWPTIGQPYTVKWNDPEDSTVTLSLYKGCPDNCKEITDIAGGIKNSGSFSWTPSNTLQAGDGYGILLINEVPCLTAWAYFGLHPEGFVASTPSGNPSSAASVAAVSSTTMAASSAASSKSKLTVTTTVYETTYVLLATSSLSSSSSASVISMYVSTPSSAMSTGTNIVASNVNTVKAVSSSTNVPAPTATAAFSSRGASTRPAHSLSICALSGVIAMLATAVIF